MIEEEVLRLLDTETARTKRSFSVPVSSDGNYSPQSLSYRWRTSVSDHFFLFLLDADEPPASTLLWIYYFLAQHCDQKRDYAKALEYVDLAIEHTPTLVESYSFKAKIYKVSAAIPLYTHPKTEREHLSRHSIGTHKLFLLSLWVSYQFSTKGEKILSDVGFTILAEKSWHFSTVLIWSLLSEKRTSPM